MAALRYAGPFILFLVAGLASAQAPQSGSDFVALDLAAEVLDQATTVAQVSEGFATYPLIVEAIDQRGGIKGNIASTRTVEGNLGRVVYRLQDAQPTALTTALRERLVDAGFKVLFECSGAVCGPTFTRASPGFRHHRDWFNVATAAQHYIALQKPSVGSDVYVAIQAARANTKAPTYVQIDVVQVEPRVVGAITVNAAEMARKLETKGRVALYGLFFATDSVEIKPASRSTLAEIAKLLQEKPDLKLLVVGHTDSRGTFEYNLQLSRRRAQSVVDALVQNYGVEPARLKPWGVSYAAPRASNANQYGRSRNRRVELVIW